MDWRSDAISWYVDGVPRNQYTGSSIAAEPLYLIQNLQVGGNDSWSGPVDASTVFPAYYDIDYVRAWQRATPWKFSEMTNTQTPGQVINLSR